MQVSRVAFLSQNGIFRRPCSRMPKHKKMPVYRSARNGSQERLAALLRDIVDVMAPRFFPSSRIIRLGDEYQSDFPRDLRAVDLARRGNARLPDVILYDHKHGWLVLADASINSRPIDGERRMELMRLFRNPRVGLVFVTAFETRRAMQGFLGSISWESEVWIAEAPDHLIHFNGERFLGPYPDAMPTQSASSGPAKQHPA